MGKHYNIIILRRGRGVKRNLPRQGRPMPREGQAPPRFAAGRCEAARRSDEFLGLSSDRKSRKDRRGGGGLSSPLGSAVAGMALSPFAHPTEEDTILYRGDRQSPPPRTPPPLESRELSAHAHRAQHREPKFARPVIARSADARRAAHITADASGERGFCRGRRLDDPLRI